MLNLEDLIYALLFAILFAIIAAIMSERFHENILLYFILLLIVALIIFGIYTRRKGKIKLLKELYVFFGKSSSITPDVLLKTRPFDTYYYRRREDDLIDEGLKNKKNLLIIGSPLSGKSRAVYEALTHLSEPKYVIIPRVRDINPESFQFPKNTEIIVIDDLHKFVEKQHFEHLLNASFKRDIAIVATCRSSMEYEKVKHRIDLETIFEKFIELPRIPKKIGKDIANKVMINWDKVKFDGNVGSIFMRLNEIETRFDVCNDTEKTILRVLRNLYICGIYEENQIFTLEWLKIAAKKVGLEGEDFQWAGWLENLRNKELITLKKKDSIFVEEVYLEDIFKPLCEEKILDVFEEMIATFSDVPEALFELGNRAHNIGTVDLEKAKYMKIAINAYEEALKVTTLERFPMQYATTQNNLGNAYSTLAEVEAKAENCREAIKAYEEALKVFTKEDFPEIYPLVETNLRNLLNFCEGE